MAVRDGTLLSELSPYSRGSCYKVAEGRMRAADALTETVQI